MKLPDLIVRGQPAACESWEQQQYLTPIGASALATAAAAAAQASGSSGKPSLQLALPRQLLHWLYIGHC